MKPGTCLEWLLLALYSSHQWWLSSSRLVASVCAVRARGPGGVSLGSRWHFQPSTINAESHGENAMKDDGRGGIKTVPVLVTSQIESPLALAPGPRQTARM